MQTMQGLLSSLQPHSVVLMIIGLLSIVPVVIQYRDESKLFVLGYFFLIVAAFATNFEDLVFETFLNYTEHIVGLMGSGLVFLTAAYLRRQHVIGDNEGAGERLLGAIQEE